MSVERGSEARPTHIRAGGERERDRVKKAKVKGEKKGREREKKREGNQSGVSFSLLFC